MDSEKKMMATIESLKAKLVTIRAGRANPAMLNGIMVSCYGIPTPIQSVANITVPEARKLFVKPFDRSTLKDIERAINEANLGIAPTNNGEMIILTIPELTEDRRKEYVKQAKNIGEEAKVALRNIRQDANNEIKKEEPPKTIYGGANPSANIKLDNEIKEKVPYEEKTIDLEKTEDLINTLNKETVKNEEEDIEVL